MTWINSSTISNGDALRTSQNSSKKEGVNVDGNTISWPDDGWYQVQSATSYNSMSEGGQSATMPAGTYIVINHTTGERFENVVVGPAAMAGLQTRDIVRPDIPVVDILNPGNNGGDRPDIPGNHLDDPSDNANSAFGALQGLAFDAMSNDSVDPVPAETRVTSTVYSAGTSDEIHRNVIHTPDTSAATSNQPYSHEIQVYSNQGLIATETYVTSPTGMRIGPTGTNGVELEKPAPAPETPKPSTTSRNQNTENDTDSRGSTGGANAGTGNETSANPHTR